MEIPEGGEYLYEWFFQASEAITRIYDGKCFKIGPVNWLSWSQITGNQIRPFEFDILDGMDSEFTKEMQSEIIAIQEKMREDARGRK